MVERRSPHSRPKEEGKTSFMIDDILALETRSTTSNWISQWRRDCRTTSPEQRESSPEEDCDVAVSVDPANDDTKDEASCNGETDISLSQDSIGQLSLTISLKLLFCV